MAINFGDKKIKHIYFGDKKIKKVYFGDTKIWSGASLVTYNVDTGNSFTEEVDEGLSVLSPVTTPTKSGYTFLGWRSDTVADSSVETSLVATGEPMTLYAVFRKTITTSFNSNNGIGSMSQMTSYDYYNNGNHNYTSITLPSNAFIRRGYTFDKWHLGSASGTEYSVGDSYTPHSNKTFYAGWTDNSYELVLYRADDTTHKLAPVSSFSNDDYYDQEEKYSLPFDTKGCAYLVFKHRGGGNQQIQVYDSDTNESLFSWSIWENFGEKQEVIDVSGHDHLKLRILSGSHWQGGQANYVYLYEYNCDSKVRLTNTQP